MTEQQPSPGAATPPMDSDDDVAENVADLPDDIPNDDLTMNETTVADGPAADTNVDAPVIGTPPTDDEIGV
jgi:hypothetical protein